MFQNFKPYTIAIFIFISCDNQKPLIDAAVFDSNNETSETSELATCDTPGQNCESLDPCAINPVCGEDHFCHPTQIQNCDDGLDCTEDICAGSGLCKNLPKTNYCALGVLENGETITKCIQAEERKPDDPCMECAPETDNINWTPATGGNCDDANDCTMDDYCQNGLCKGSYFGDKCNDNLSCTEDICDGKGGCLGNPQISNTCLINGQCYADGDKDPNECNICDSSQSATSWTPIIVHCWINDTCYLPDEKNSTGCGICDPDVSTSSWTPLTNICKISNLCYQPGDKYSTGCAHCDPSVNATAWTPLPGYCLINSSCYSSGDKHSTNCKACDPTQSQTAWTDLSGLCKIDGVCYQPGTKHPKACAECNINVDPTAWTPLSGYCLINNECYSAGDKDPTNCAICDPTQKNNDWTALSGLCLINGQCFSAGDMDSSACGICDPTQNDTAWTVIADKCTFMSSGGTIGISKNTILPTNYVAIDMSGNSYVIGDFNYLASFGTTTLSGPGMITQHMFVAKFGPNGERLWISPFSSASILNYDRTESIATDTTGNVYIVGAFSGKGTFGTTTITSGGVTDVFVAKYSSDGLFQWAKNFGGAGSDRGNDIKVDTNGNLFITGDFTNLAVFGSFVLNGLGQKDIFVAQLDQNGQPTWATSAGGSDWAYANGIAVDNSSNPYITGRFTGTIGFGTTTLTCAGSFFASDIFAAKFDQGGQPRWATSAKVGLNGGMGRRIAIDATGNAYVTGYFNNKTTFGTTTLSSNGDSEIFVSKIDTVGQYSWAVSIGGTSEDEGNGIAFDRNGSVIAVGSFMNQMIFGTTTLSSKGGPDVFVAKISESGQKLWATSAGGTSSDEAAGVVMDSSGNVFVSGATTNPASFGPFQLTTSTIGEVFVWKLVPP